MKRGIIWIALTCIMVIALVLASCSSSTTTMVTQQTTSTTSIPVTTTASTAVTSTSTSPAATVTATTTSTGHWWDSLSSPQYGGTLVQRLGADISNFDPYYTPFGTGIAWLERLTFDNWVTDPKVYDFKITWRPPDYLEGQLAQGWEFTDPNTFVFHIRQGVHWQNIAPANGREFVANDVVLHFNRLYGLNGTKGSTYYTSASYANLVSLTAPDKYTVVFKWSTNNPELIMETLLIISNEMLIENPEAVAQWGNVNDWHHAIGTGPFILTDFVSLSSVTEVRNPNYWGYDERYPQNQLPYINTLKFIIIASSPTALAAMRVGKIDACGGTLTDSKGMKQTNPEILQISTPSNSNTTMDPRNDVVPFNDIRVREAMQLAINLPLLASSYYSDATSPLPLELTAYAETGWAWPYDQWPQELKDQYAYNPTGAKALLTAAGYPNGFSTNIVVDSGADQDFVLVIQSFLKAVNINMQIIVMDTSSWNNYVSVNKKQDQMAMRGGGSLALQYEPLRQLSRLQTGYSTNYARVNDPVLDAFYPAFVACTSVAQEKAILRDANERVLRQHYVLSFVESVSFSFYQPWLKGYNGQYGALGSLTCSYLARFWLDQNLKTSLGH